MVSQPKKLKPLTTLMLEVLSFGQGCLEVPEGAVGSGVLFT